MVEKLHISYNQIHESLRDAVIRHRINEEFQPDIMIAIGGGGFIPARILRTFLEKRNNKNIPIQAIGLSLYEELEQYDKENEEFQNQRTDSGSVTPSIPPPPQVTKTQWLNFGGSDSLANLAGRNILIVDEVDDTRQTLSYAVQELLRDIEKQEKATPGHKPTKLGVFVLHNKVKQKKASLPDEIMKNYFACVDMPDHWLVYPWDAIDIEEHTEKANRKELVNE
ncbi:hypothetical protein INT44_007927 [Umbelopsis vinacea]|uniref:Uncharacterized protein n=1 Tax=Umbelopsis vinacea TaxID=44442 RepID=A0A8H7PNY3_9FUNG|nr:hypothetical protein INT44_007927 [Umbelopsis vinacea]